MRNIYRLSILVCCFFALGYSSNAQPFGNEWIDYSKTYYKFKITQEGIYHISKATLDAAGIPSFITGNQYVIYKDGQQVPLYVTTVGAFGANDYIEFYGKGPNGKLDKRLYNDPNWHINDSVSLFTDTASYFLTYGNQNYARYAAIPAGIPGSLPPAEQYIWFLSAKNFKNYQMPGTNYSSADHLFSSQFDCAEALVDANNGISTPGAVTMNTPNIFPGGPDATVKINLAALDPYPVQVPIRVFMNNQQIKVDTLQLNPQPSVAKRFNIATPVSLLQTNNTITYTTTYNIPGLNMMGTALAEIQYPRNCDLSNATNFTFSLKPTTSNQYLEFTSFNHGGVAPRLFDLTNNKVYTGDVTTIPGLTRFYLDPSNIERTLVLVAQNSNFISNITPAKTVNFTNFSVAPNVGNYVIITHNKLKIAADQNDYVNDYKTYRSSAAGGGYTVVVADVEELYDQFAYGVEIHPLSIKNFLHYAHTNWLMKPEYCLLLGRGLLYHSYNEYKQNISTYPYPIVPTFGDPGSDADFVNFGSDFKLKIKIGRISAWNGMEIGHYLNKIKNYEAALPPAAFPRYDTELWKKSFIHIAGGSDIALQTTLLNTLNKGAAIITKPYTGAIVTTVAKNTTTPLDQAGSELVNAMIDSGAYWLTFHGHASSGSFDFNLNNPEQYTNQPRLLHLMALGCDVSQIFNLTTLRTISERYINADGAAVSVIAQDNLGYTSFHEPYFQRFYRSISKFNYLNSTLGIHYNHSFDSTLMANNVVNNANNFFYTEMESFILLGDPATKMFSLPQADYHISNESISSIPNIVTTALDSFELKITAFNLGQAASDTSAGVKDTVYVKVEHINPQGSNSLIGIYPMVNLYNKADHIIKVPIDGAVDLGLNKYIATIDHDNKWNESSEINNGGTFNLFIYSDNLIPVYPPEFAIVGNQDITLKASTLNPFKPAANYKIEIDTTELFNSPQLQQYSTTSIGGVIQWKPNVAYKDSLVYYWRTALDSGNSTNPIWTASSFIYLPQKNGWNQSHYFQYKKDAFKTLGIDNARLFNYKIINNQLFANNKVFYANDQVNDVKVMFNDVDIQRSGCPPFAGTIQIFVLDSLTAQRWQNPVGGTGGSNAHCLGNRNAECFEFPVNSESSRNNAMNFLNSIPDNNYVLIRNFIYDPLYQPSFAQDWVNDNSGGSNLYNTLKGLGFSQLDSFNQKRVFIFMCKKNNANFQKEQIFSAGATDKIQGDFIIKSYANNGIMYSKSVGPAKQWEELKWRTSGAEAADSVYVKVIGIDNNSTETVLFNTQNTDTSLAGISTSMYPKLKLEWYTKDTFLHTSTQLNYWRVHYVPVPEAALNPTAHFVFQDSLSVGQPAKLELAIEELSGLPMDSMLVKYKVIDANGVAHDVGSSRYKKLNGNDTLHASIEFNPEAYPGSNFLFIEANPADDQPEQYHPNNLGYIPFKVFVDNLNPLIDVTFDGVHILDKDIVSSKPFIKMLLKDENKFLMIDDTSLIDVSIRYLGRKEGPPSSTPAVDLPFDGTIMKFIPATSAGKNEGVIEYRPTFLEDGLYELSVNGRDKSGNKSGATDYRVSFEVINKSTITNILNYPNPFSTSTAFLFTLTGSQIPSQFKIQVLSVTGKLVREITKAELGPLHIGRNITEYKWDGKDQYGQMLGNGVYLYRVVTTVNGQDIERRDNGEADKFTHKGYGKMYIMR
jgi:hypothetical protein